MTKAEIKKAVCKEINYWMRNYGKFARESFDKSNNKKDKHFHTMHYTDYTWQARICRILRYAKEGIFRKLAIN